MTNNSPFDNHIKGEFENYSPDVPPHIWQNILSKKDRRKPVGFWVSFLTNRLNLFIIGILVITGGILLFQHTNSPATGSPGKDNQTTNESKALAGNINTDHVVNQPGTSTNSGTNTNAITSPSSLPINEVNNNIATPGKNDPLPINNTKNTHHIARTTKENIHVKKTTGLSTNELANNKDLNGHNSIIEKNNATKNIVGSITGNQINNHVQKNLSRKTRLTTPSSASLNIIAGETGTDDYTIGSKTTTKELFSLNRFLLDIQPSDRKKTFNPVSLKKPDVPNLNIPCPEAEKNSAGNKKYIEFYAGPDYASSKLSDTANSTYLKKRAESTSFSSAFSVGVRYTRVFRSGVSIRTGINYSQINEKFSFAQGNIIQTTYITDINGDTTGSYATSGTRYKTTYNKFRTIDIPLLFGYELGNGRFHTNINAGAVVNLYSWQKGDVLDATYQPVNVTTGKSSSPYQLKTNVGVGFMGAVSVYYKLNARMHLLAEPYFRYNFSPASKAELTLKQKYNTVGLRLGLRVDF